MDIFKHENTDGDMAEVISFVIIHKMQSTQNWLPNVQQYSLVAWHFYSWTVNLLYYSILRYTALINQILQSIGNKAVCSVLLQDKLCNDDTGSKLMLFTARWTIFFYHAVQHLYSYYKFLSYECLPNNSVPSICKWSFHQSFHPAYLEQKAKLNKHTLWPKCDLCTNKLHMYWLVKSALLKNLTSTKYQHHGNLIDFTQYILLRHFHNHLPRKMKCSLQAREKGTFKAVFALLTRLPKGKDAIILKNAQCSKCRHTNIQCKALIKVAQQHATALMYRMHLFHSWCRPWMWHLPPRGTVNTALSDAGASHLCWLRA